MTTVGVAGAGMLVSGANQVPGQESVLPGKPPLKDSVSPAQASQLVFESSYDVVITGAGVAGVAAALAAARYGAKTCLIEKTVYPGGLATSGCVNYYLPLSDSRGNQVTFGLSEELLMASLKYGPGDIPQDWMKGPEPKSKIDSRYGAKFSPMSFVLALDELLREAGVDVWLDTLVCGTQVEAGRLTGIEVENKSGRGLVKGKVFVDSSGDADVAFRAGAPCVTELNNLTLWGLSYDLTAAQEAVKQSSGDPLMKLIQLGAWDDGSGHPKGIRKFSGVDGKDVSEFILTGRKLALEHYKREQNNRGANGRKDFFPAFLPAMADFRQTRRIEGILTFHDGNCGKFRHLPDCVGIAADWRGGSNLWEVPYRSLLTRKVRGLMAAGRCIGASINAWAVMRVIQAAAMTGEVCGLASAMSQERGITPDALDVATLQSEQKKRKFLLDLRELKLPDQEVKDAPPITIPNAKYYE